MGPHTLSHFLFSNKHVWYNFTVHTDPNNRPRHFFINLTTSSRNFFFLFSFHNYLLGQEATRQTILNYTLTCSNTASAWDKEHLVLVNLSLVAGIQYITSRKNPRDRMVKTQYRKTLQELHLYPEHFCKKERFIFIIIIILYFKSYTMYALILYSFYSNS